MPTTCRKHELKKSGINYETTGADAEETCKEHWQLHDSTVLFAEASGMRTGDSQVTQAF